MKNLFYTFITFGLVVVFSGCSGSVRHMDVAPANKVIEAPKTGKAKIVFMRPSSFGYAVGSSVFEIKDNKPEVIGLVAAKTKVEYDLEPGEHLFMVVGESADFMSANLEANKTYYSIVSARMGAWKARFSIKPVSDISPEKLQAYLKKCKLVEKSGETVIWAESNQKNIQAKYDKYYEDWMNKDISSRPHINKEDGL